MWLQQRNSVRFPKRKIKQCFNFISDVVEQSKTFTKINQNVTSMDYTYSTQTMLNLLVKQLLLLPQLKKHESANFAGITLTDPQSTCKTFSFETSSSTIFCLTSNQKFSLKIISTLMKSSKWLKDLKPCTKKKEPK